MKKYGLGLIGFILIAFGVNMTINVHDVGLEPWSAVLLGLSKSSLTYGTWNIIIHFGFITLTFLMEKRTPRIGTFLNMLIISPLIDFFIWLNFFPEIHSVIGQYFFFALGVVVTSFGMALSIVSGIGAGSKTQFYVVLQEKTQWKLSFCKNIMECVGVVIAFLVGGPLFIGTILFIFISAMTIEFFVSKMKKQT